MREVESRDVSAGTQNVWTVVVAAGSGSRFGGPKQLVELAGKRVLDWSLDLAFSCSAGVVVVVPANERDAIEGSFRANGQQAGEVSTSLFFVPGGATRSASVRCGLEAVPETASIVIIHDGARPAAPPALFGAVITPIVEGDADAVIPVVPVVDTLRWRDGSVIDRDRVVAVQTPQAFDATWIRKAHRDGPDATDDAALVEQIGARLIQVPGAPENQKLTVRSDVPTLEAVLAERQRSSR